MTRPTPSDSMVSFEVQCPLTRPGEHIRVVGSLPELGTWAPEKSLAVLSTSNEAFPTWRSEWLSLPYEAFEYKYVICRAAGDYRWESRPNRHLSTLDRPLEIKEGFSDLQQEPDSGEEIPEKEILRLHSKESLQSTVADLDEGSPFDLVPSIPSWDSGFSGLCATVGDLSHIAECGTAALEQSDVSHSRCTSALSSCPLLEGSSEGRILHFPSCKTFEDGFDLGRMLGEGAFGTVRRCTERLTAVEYAVKVVSTKELHPLDQAALVTEVQLQQAMPVHNNIVRLYRSFEEVGVTKIVMEMCQGGDLSAHIDDLRQRHRWKGGDPALSESAAANVTRQLVTALEFCHAHGVVHRDVKPGNIIFAQPAKQAPLEKTSSVVKLCDFGYAAECWPDDPPALRECVGTPEYLAPEVARRENYGCAIDVWSAGVVLFECLRGHVPWMADQEEETLKLVQQANYSFRDGWSGTSDQAKSCVKHILVEAAQRPTAETVLEHPWLNGC